jgi:FKBP-type peptidyl-prolyl cis-trans isomerase
MLKVNTFILLFFSILFIECGTDTVPVPTNEAGEITAYWKSFKEKNKGKIVKFDTLNASGIKIAYTKLGFPKDTLSKGTAVRVSYTGKFLSNDVFSKDTSHTFILGSGAIKGFDDSIVKMKLGESATIIIPSSLGYSSVKAKGIDKTDNNKETTIPAYSPLVFEVSVLEIQLSQTEQIALIGKYAKAYIKENKAKIIKYDTLSSSGLKIFYTKQGLAKDTLSKGQIVTVGYTGSFLDNRLFSKDPSYIFELGKGVPQGLNQGIAKMKIGDEGIILFPSDLGYGSVQAKGIDKTNNNKETIIPSYSPVIFSISSIKR